LLRILVLGKYPPIQGGVSGATFRLAQELAIRGHDVSVVTNSGEVEFGFREFFWGEDESRLDREYGEGSLKVLQTESLAPNSYVPWANPYVSKLAGRAIAVANARGCDAIVGVYLEPYGVAAALVSTAIQKPLIVRHAGSDVGRLSKHQDLAETYRWVLSKADAVVTGASLGNVYDNLLSLGVASSQLKSLGASALPEWFYDSDEILDLMELADAFTASSWPMHLFPQTFREIVHADQKRIEKDLLTIGTFGKVGVAKGSFVLVEALKKLAIEGYQFNFVTLAGGTSETLSRYYGSILESESLRERSWILPLIAPWRVPAFVRACSAIAFLEHDFPIAHRPRIPREVLATGTCLICSSEIADKQGFGVNLVHRKNYVRIEAPNDEAALSSELANLIDHPERCHSIGKHGQFLSRVIERGLPRIDPLVELIERTATAH
jgi:glycosyltransferase involved in cell wall biosynthesis